MTEEVEMTGNMHLMQYILLHTRKAAAADRPHLHLLNLSQKVRHKSVT